MKKKFARIIKFMTASVLAAAITISAMPGCVSARSSSTSDNGDGTFTNPNVYLDVPDIDMIRVGENYYMVSTYNDMSRVCPF